MEDALVYPFDIGMLSRKRKRERARLLDRGPLTDVKVAILGGSTTADVRDFLELFLLASKLRPVFYLSQFDRYYEEAVVEDATLRAFAPDVVFVHTTHRNVKHWPALADDEAAVEAAFASERTRFEQMWSCVLARTNAILIQNNFDLPALEPLGHLEATAKVGRSHFLARLNGAFADQAQKTSRMRVNDIHAIASRVGLHRWATARDWLLYRKALTTEGSAHVAHAVARIVRAARGKSKKCLVVDLDDTLWGGVVGEDGVDRLRLGPDSPEGEAFLDVQRYCIGLRKRGILLAACSKNDDAVARSGFTHPDSLLRASDFSAFVANWQPKPDNLRAIAERLGIGLDSLVFLDDNPAERALVERELPEVAVAKVGDPTTFTEVLDREGYFEPFTLAEDDGARAQYYATNAARTELATTAPDYDAFLGSLEMEAVIAPFSEPYLARITQLVNKTNQFNLTTRRLTEAQVEGIARNPEYVTLHARLRDKFGDNGLVSALAARLRRDELHVDLWLMSCRVLKRDLELAMFDALVESALARGVVALVGRYEPSDRNGVVADHYRALGFTEAGGGEWRLEVAKAAPKNRHIRRLR